MKLVAIRHGSTGEDANRKKGQGEYGLCDNGRQQAKSIKDKVINLFESNPDAVYTSDLPRAEQTAEIIFTNRHIIRSQKLREQDYGVATGLLGEEASREYPKYQGEYDLSYPNGESIQDVYSRVSEFMEEIGRKHKKSDSVVLFTHATPIYLLEVFANNLSIKENSDSSYQVPSNCGILVGKYHSELDIIKRYYSETD